MAKAEHPPLVLPGQVMISRWQTSREREALAECVTLDVEGERTAAAWKGSRSQLQIMFQ